MVWWTWHRIRAHCGIVELRLQGYHLDEITGQTACSLSTVCRVLAQHKEQLEQG